MAVASSRKSRQRPDVELLATGSLVDRDWEAKNNSMCTSVMTMEVTLPGRKIEGMEKCFKGTGGHFDDANVMPAVTMAISEANVHNYKAISSICPRPNQH